MKYYLQLFIYGFGCVNRLFIFVVVNVSVIRSCFLEGFINSKLLIHILCKYKKNETKKIQAKRAYVVLGNILQYGMCVYETNLHKEFSGHVVRIHKNDPRFLVYCQIGESSLSTKVWNSFKQHVSNNIKILFYLVLKRSSFWWVTK